MNMTSNLSRRGFLAAGAALGALAATGGTTWLLSLIHILSVATRSPRPGATRA